MRDDALVNMGLQSYGDDFQEVGERRPSAVQIRLTANYFSADIGSFAGPRATLEDGCKVWLGFGASRALVDSKFIGSILVRWRQSMENDMSHHVWIHKLDDTALLDLNPALDLITPRNAA